MSVFVATAYIKGTVMFNRKTGSVITYIIQCNDITTYTDGSTREDKVSVICKQFQATDVTPYAVGTLISVDGVLRTNRYQDKVTQEWIDKGVMVVVHHIRDEQE